MNMGVKTMKITKINVFRLVGRDKDALDLFESKHQFYQDPNQSHPHEAVFTEIETDEGFTGLCIGGSQNVKELGQLLIGEDPFRIEYLWEKMFNWKYSRYGHIHDMGILDLALWDLMGKIKKEPVYRLLGGHVQDRIPAYAALLGFSLEPERAAERSLEYVNQGYKAIKWYLGFNELHGMEGFKGNIDLVAAVRKAVGDDIGIMVDFANSNPEQNSLFYMIRLAKRLEEYNVTWLEEPLLYDDVAAYKKLSQSTSIPIACGEHLYTRLQLKAFLESEAITIYQPDSYFASGLTEMRRMMGLLSSYGVTVIPHANESCIHAAHLLFSTPSRVSPMGEFGIKLNRMFQHFFKFFYQPVNGYFELPQGSGFGYEIDPDKVIEKRIL
jgi:L-rhamnonate dehydratase